MAKVIGKGTVLKQTISMVLTAVAQCTSIEHSGAADGVYDSTTLDGAAGRTKDPTGYYEPGTLSVEMLYDPALAGHQAVTDQLLTPADTVWEVTFANAGSTTQSFTVAGVGFGWSAQMDDGLRASVELTIDGAAGFPT